MGYILNGKHENDPRACRDGYVDAMLEMMAKDENLVHVDCDLAGCIGSGKIQKAYPDRMFNVGIAEQNSVGVAAGLAAAGLNPFVHTFGTFASRRCFDQAFLSSAYSKLPVHIIGTDPGVTAGFNGGTHMPFEDAGLYLSVPEAVVIDICDYTQARSLTPQVAKCQSLTYMRLVRKGHKNVYADGSEFEIGKGVTLKEGGDVAIIASGIMVDEALQAYEQLEAEGIHATVIDMHTWKPLDEELILKVAKETGCIVTAENHQIATGLGSAVANLLAEKMPTPLERVGVLDRFGQVGPVDFLKEEYNLVAKDIVAAAKKAIARK